MYKEIPHFVRDDMMQTKGVFALAINLTFWQNFCYIKDIVLKISEKSKEEESNA